MFSFVVVDAALVELDALHERWGPGFAV